MDEIRDNNLAVYDEDNDTTRNKFLTMEIGQELFGLEIAMVKEIISVPAITKVPKTPEYIKGIINLRGDIVPVVDIRSRFKIEERAYDDATCIVVIEQEGFNVGIIVDNVKDVKYIKNENITSPPSAKLNHTNKYIKNIGRDSNKVILILETEKLLYEAQPE